VTSSAMQSLRGWLPSDADSKPEPVGDGCRSWRRRHGQWRDHWRGVKTSHQGGKPAGGRGGGRRYDMIDHHVVTGSKRMGRWQSVLTSGRYTCKPFKVAFMHRASTQERAAACRGFTRPRCEGAEANQHGLCSVQDVCARVSRGLCVTWRWWTDDLLRGGGQISVRSVPRETAVCNLWLPGGDRIDAGGGGKPARCTGQTRPGSLRGAAGTCHASGWGGQRGRHAQRE